MGDARPRKFIRLVDLDARAELRRVPVSDWRHCPRVGERIELAADRELGGGVYEVVGVVHLLADGEEQGDPASVTGMRVELRPVHDDEVGEEAVAAELIPETVSWWNDDPPRPEPAD